MSDGTYEYVEPSETFLLINDEMLNTRAAGLTDETEPNNTSSQADRTYDDYDSYGVISSTSDIDWWVVSFSSSGYANFWLGYIPSGCDYDMRLYASDGSTLLGASLNSGNSAELIGEYWVSANTNYYIKINSYSGSSTTNSYQFRAKNYPWHGYAGFQVGTGGKGVSATITMPTSLPNVSDSGESVWVSTGKDLYDRWLQTGARYYYGYTGFQTYIEHFNNGGYGCTTVGTHNLGASITYKTDYNTSDNKWHAFIAGTDLLSSTLSSNSVGVECYAEIHKKQIEMGPFSFSNVKIKDSSGTWGNNTVTPTAPSPYSCSGTATSFTVSGP